MILTHVTANAMSPDQDESDFKSIVSNAIS